jgi:hypothetical protein
MIKKEASCGKKKQLFWTRQRKSHPKNEKKKSFWTSCERWKRHHWNDTKMEARTCFV